MTLYDYLVGTSGDCYTYDRLYNFRIVVSVPEGTSSFDKFISVLYQHLLIAEVRSKTSLVVLWSEYIRRNLDLFREYANKHWDYDKDLDDTLFIKAWLEELDIYMQGTNSEGLYDELTTFISTTKPMTSSQTKVFV